MWTSRSGASSLALLAFALCCALVGCSNTGTAQEASRGPAGTVTEAGSVPVFALQEGDCIDEPDLAGADDGAGFTELRAVPCSAEHTAEVIGVDRSAFDAAASYPGDDQVAQLASDACEARLEQYTQIAAASGGFDVIALFPTATSWVQANDRGVACLGMTVSEATGEAQSSTGSIKAR